MDTPNINTIKAMPKKDLEALNSQLARKLATRVVGVVLLRLAMNGVMRVLVQKAVIEAAKRA